MSNRRVVHSAITEVTEAIKARKARMAEPQRAPLEHKPLGEQQMLERQLYLANLALNKYQTKLEAGIELNPEEERLFLAHQDGIRKLETTHTALRSKANLGKKKDHELAQDMVRSGIPKDQVLALYPDDRRVANALEEL